MTVRLDPAPFMLRDFMGSAFVADGLVEDDRVSASIGIKDLGGVACVSFTRSDVEALRAWCDELLGGN